MTVGRRWYIDNINEYIYKIDIIGIRKKIRKVRLIYYKIRYKNLITANSSLKNIHSHKPFVLLGNGCSLLEIDILKIYGCIKFGCNEIFQHKKFNEFDLDYYTVGEPYYGSIFGRKYVEDVVRLYSDINDAFHEKRTQHFYHATLKSFFTKRKLFQKSQNYYYIGANLMADTKTQSHELNRPISLADGGLFLMIAASIYMGAKEIYLLGCGYTYLPVQELHFYDSPSIEQNSSQEDIIKFERDLANKYPNMSANKFTEFEGRMYYSITRKSDDIDYFRHSLILRYANEKNVRIINVLPNGFSSPIYEKIGAEEFMRKMTPN